MMKQPKLIHDSAFGYEVHLHNAIIGRVGKGDKGWQATLGEFDLGQHKTRREAVDAMMDVYST